MPAQACDEELVADVRTGEVRTLAQHVVRGVCTTLEEMLELTPWECAAASQEAFLYVDRFRTRIAACSPVSHQAAGPLIRTSISTCSPFLRHCRRRYLKSPDFLGVVLEDPELGRVQPKPLLSRLGLCGAHS